MKKIISILLLCCGIFCFSACGNGSAVAEVNGKSLDLASYEAYMENLEAIYAANATDLPEDITDSVLEQMVYEELLLQSAAEKDCLPTDAEAAAYFESEMTELYGSLAEGLAQLERFGVAEDFFRNQYRMRLTENNLTALLTEEAEMNPDAGTGDSALLLTSYMAEREKEAEIVYHYEKIK